ncbi:DMT family transporter [Alphaproteobacteria bacterium]|jgi:drug/metabolite transporter (DMT)-like permease|nr:DMT family transporter [Alphaproteobacteria bacterium]
MKSRDYILYALVVFGWSTSWYPLKQQLGVVAPEVSLFWRFLAASMLMFALAIFQGHPLQFRAKDHLTFMALGLCLFSANFTSFYYAGMYSASGLLAVAFSTASLIIVLMLAVMTRSLPKISHLIAAITGILGVLLLYLPELQISTTASVSLALCIIGTLFFCTGNLVSAASQRRGLPVVSASSWGMAYGALFLLVFSAVRGKSFMIEMTPAYIWSLLWLVVISSVITFASYLTLIGRIGAGKAGYATVVFPVFALLISTALEGYEWSAYAFIGLALVVTGNIIMARSRR